MKNNNKSSNKSNNNIFLGWAYTNGIVCIGHPVERWKVALQIAIDQSPMRVTSKVISNYQTLFTAISSTIFRQNAKYIYRTPLFVWMPPKVDEIVKQPILAAAVKGAIGSFADTVVVTPVETIKTVQMQSMNRVNIQTAAKSIYQSSGMFGFYRGARVSALKSYPTWFHLFLGYHLTQSKHEKGAFLDTIFWATMMSLPISFITTPLDVLKTRQQANLAVHSNAIMRSAKELISSHGIFALWRGFTARAVHKSLTTAGAYLVMNMAKESRLQK